MSGIQGVANAPQTGLQHERVHVTWPISTKSLAFANNAIYTASLVMTLQNPTYWLGALIGFTLMEARSSAFGFVSAEVNDKTSLIQEIAIRNGLIRSLVARGACLALVLSTDDSNFDIKRDSLFSLSGVLFGGLFGYGLCKILKNPFALPSSVETRTVANVEEPTSPESNGATFVV